MIAELFLHHAAELQRFLQGVLRDNQLAQDVLQVTFAKLVEQGHRTQRESRKAWLFRVAYNEALAYRRRQAVGSKVRRHFAWGHDPLADAADEPVLRWERVEMVRAAIEQLPRELRDIVRMRIYEEKTFAVIADELGIPLGTALGRMRQAMTRLRAALDAEHSEGTE